MAAPTSSENMSNSNSDEESDETNLLSPNFNPLKALYSCKVQLPFPKATIFNNLREYERIVALGDRSGRRGDGHRRGNEAGDGRSLSPSREKSHVQKEPVVRESTQRDSNSTKTRTRRKNEPATLGAGFRATQEMLIDTWKNKPNFRNALTRMTEFTSGPMSVLYRCMNERCKVRVCTRSFKGLRGICTGYLVTFDKFFNMALVDVDEVWRRPSTGQRFYHEEKVTFSKIMECSKTQELQKDRSRTQRTKEADQFRKGDTTFKKHQHEPEKYHRDRHTKGSFSKSKRENREHSTKDLSSASELDNRQQSARDSPSESKNDRRHSKTSRGRDSREHKRKDKDGKSSKNDKNRSKEKQRRSKKDRLKSEERAKKNASEPDGSDEDDEDIEELQQQLAALQRELTSISVNSDEEGSSEETEGKTEENADTETELAALCKELTSLCDDNEVEGSAAQGTDSKTDAGAKSRNLESRDSERTDQSATSTCHGRTLAEGSTVVKESGRSTKGEGSKIKDDSLQQDKNVADENIEIPGDKGESLNVECADSKPSSSKNAKQGRLEIQPEDFQRRHVNQLFVRGDNVVLVSVDSNLLPK